MEMEQLIDALAYGFIWSILFTYISNGILFYIIKKINEEQFIFFNAVTLFELSALFILGFIRLLFLSDYSIRERSILLFLLLLLTVMSLKFGMHIYGKSKKENLKSPMDDKMNH